MRTWKITSINKQTRVITIHGARVPQALVAQLSSVGFTVTVVVGSK